MMKMHPEFRPRSLQVLYLILLPVFFYSFTGPVAQVATFDTIYQTDNGLFWLAHANDYLYWREFTEDGVRIYRMYDGVIDTQQLPAGHESCNTHGGIYAYEDFLYYKLNRSSGMEFCEQGFVWDGDSLTEDPYFISRVCAKYKNLLLNQYGELFDMDTKRWQVFGLQDELYQYRSSNICSLKDSLVTLKAWKYLKGTSTFVGQSIIQYNRYQDQLKEIFFSEHFLHFNNQPLGGELLDFTENDHDLPPDSIRLYYYDGEQVLLLDRGLVSAAYPYLGGVVYSNYNGLFFWKDGFTTSFSDETYPSITIDHCRLAWFSGFGTNHTLTIYNGSSFYQAPLSGRPNEDFLFFHNDTFLLFSINDPDLDQGKMIMIK